MHSESRQSRHTANATHRLRRLTLLGLILGQLLGTLLVVFTCRDGECPLQRMRRVIDGDDSGKTPDLATELAKLGVSLIDGVGVGELLVDGQVPELPCEVASAKSAQAFSSPFEKSRPAFSPVTMTTRALVATFHDARGQRSRSLLRDAPKQSPPIFA